MTTLQFAVASARLAATWSQAGAGWLAGPAVAVVAVSVSDRGEPPLGVIEMAGRRCGIRQDFSGWG